MPYRKLDVLIGAAYFTSGGNWENKTLYINNYAWKQIIEGDGENNVNSIESVKLDLKDHDNSSVIVLFNTKEVFVSNLRCEEVINSDVGNGMRYFYITAKLSKWPSN